MLSNPVIVYRSQAFTVLLVIFVLVPNMFFIYEITQGVRKDGLQHVTENAMALFYLYFLYAKHERIITFTKAIAIIFGIGYTLLFIGTVFYNAFPLVRDMDSGNRMLIIVILGVLIAASVYILMNVKRYISKTV
jgi:hypothetical protein